MDITISRSSIKNASLIVSLYILFSVLAFLLFIGTVFVLLFYFKITHRIFLLFFPFYLTVFTTFLSIRKMKNSKRNIIIFLVFNLLISFLVFYLFADIGKCNCEFGDLCYTRGAKNFSCIRWWQKFPSL